MARFTLKIGYKDMRNNMIDETFGEDVWNTLTKEEQLKCFCAISRRIYKGELEDTGTYRYVLYDVFEFGPEAYGEAQLAGYLSIHNVLSEGIQHYPVDYSLNREDIQPVLIKQKSLAETIDEAIDDMSDEMKREINKMILSTLSKKSYRNY